MVRPPGPAGWPRISVVRTYRMSETVPDCPHRDLPGAGAFAF